MWNYNDVLNSKVGIDSFAKLKFPVRDSLKLSMMDSFGYSYPWRWSTALNYDSGHGDSYYYQADWGTVFVAPFSANYSFYTTADDASALYVSRKGVNVQETLIAQNPWYSWSKTFYVFASQVSKPITLTAGERLYMRIRCVNTGKNAYFCLCTLNFYLYCHGVLKFS